jgi:hypothetical protein
MRSQRSKRLVFATAMLPQMVCFAIGNAFAQRVAENMKDSTVAPPSLRLSEMAYSIPSKTWSLLNGQTISFPDPACEGKIESRTKRHCEIDLVSSSGQLVMFRGSQSGPFGVSDGGGWQTHYNELDAWPVPEGTLVAARTGLTAYCSVWRCSYYRIKQVQTRKNPGKEGELFIRLEYDLPIVHPHELTLARSEFDNAKP